MGCSVITRRDFFPARRGSTEAARRGETSPATSPAGAQPVTKQPPTEQAAHPGWYLPDLARAALGQLMPFVAVLLCSYRVSQWLALGLSLAWLGYRTLSTPRLRSSSLARVERTPARRGR